MTEDVKKLDDPHPCNYVNEKALEDKPECKDCETPGYCGRIEPAKPSSATMGFNSVVFKPETRVNKAEDAEQPKRLEHDTKGVSCSCRKPEQPNQNIMIILEIEGCISQINEKLGKMGDEMLEMGFIKRKCLISAALEEIDLFQKTTLRELKQAFE